MRGHTISDAESEWKQLTTDLAACLGDLDEDDFLIVSYKRANYFVQFAGQGKFGMRVEAVANNFIEPPESRLTEADYAAMDDIGWQRATNVPPQDDDEEPVDGSPNFFIDVSYPVDFELVADLAVRTLREVYQV